MPSDFEGFIDYEKIKEKIKAIIDARDFKVVVIDSDGNIVGDISLSALRDEIILKARPYSFMDFGRNPPICEAGEIVDLESEGIPVPFEGHSGKALKVSVDGGSKEFRIYCPYLVGNYTMVYEILLYLKGDISLNRVAGAWWQAASSSNLKDTWHKVFQAGDNDIYFKVSGTGSIYIATLELIELKHFLRYHASYPCRTLNNETVYYYFFVPPHKYAVHVQGKCHGDGSNPITVRLQGYLPNKEWKTIRSFSTTSTSLQTFKMVAPAAPVITGKDGYLTNMMRFRLEVSTEGTGYFQEFLVVLTEIEDSEIIEREYEEYSASETSDTATTHTLAYFGSRLHDFENVELEVTIASGGGSVQILANGLKMSPIYTESGTYRLPDLKNVYVLSARIAGDGTNPSSVKFKAVRVKKLWGVGSDV